MRLADMVDTIWQQNEGEGPCASCRQCVRVEFGRACRVLIEDLHPAECVALTDAAPECWLPQVAA